MPDSYPATVPPGTAKCITPPLNEESELAVLPGCNALDFPTGPGTDVAGPRSARSERPPEFSGR